MSRLRCRLFGHAWEYRMDELDAALIGGHMFLLHVWRCRRCGRAHEQGASTVWLGSSWAAFAEIGGHNFPDPPARP